MPMIDAQIANAILNHETFVCAWCYEFEPDAQEEYTYGYEWLGGYTVEGKPLCDGCVDAAHQDMSDNTEAA